MADDRDNGKPAPSTEQAQEMVRYSQGQVRRARGLLSRLFGARRAARLYPLDHPVTHEAIRALGDSIAGYHAEGVDVQFTFHEDEVLFGDQLLAEESVLFDQLVRDITAIGAGSLTFKRGMTGDELERAVMLLAMDATAVDAAGGIAAMVKHRGLDHIQFAAVGAVERVTPRRGEESEESRSAHAGAVSLVREMDRLMRIDRQVPPAKIKGVVRSLVDNVLTNRYSMLQLAGLKNYEEYTYYHSANVAILSLALGAMVTSDYRFLSSLGVGALLHDIGKLSVDSTVLNKPGALTPDEWEMVRRHPLAGAQLVAFLPGVDKSAVVTILEHHMRLDGKGYPERTPPRRQHLVSRIVAVADCYDAMTSQRSYSAARTNDEAMAMIARSAGTALDPALVRLFIRLLGVYPPGSVVRLSDDRIAVVVRPTNDTTRPVVRIIAGPSGDLLERTDLDLAEEGRTTIRACIDPRMLDLEIDE